MNKKYIDFVPAKQEKEKKTQPEPRKVKSVYRVMPETPSPKVQSKTETRIVKKRIVQSREIKPQLVSSSKVDFRTVDDLPKMRRKTTDRIGNKHNEEDFFFDDEPKLGVIEELDTDFIGEEIEKRPLGEKNPVEKRDELKEAKSRRLIGRRVRKEPQVVEKPVDKSVEKPVESKTTMAKAAYRLPNSPFINQEKVVKRPLSKNVYQAPVEAPKEESQGPVTIISKPEKDKHVSLIVTVIITIILGAAAGTVAFLLLPK